MELRTLEGMNMNRLFRAVVLALTTVVAVGCGQPTLIDRTGPNFIKKSELDGTWYIQETVIDAPKTTGPRLCLTLMVG